MALGLLLAIVGIWLVINTVNGNVSKVLSGQATLGAPGTSSTTTSTPSSTTATAPA